jgi:hypothetical protein
MGGGCKKAIKISTFFWCIFLALWTLIGCISDFLDFKKGQLKIIG